MHGGLKLMYEISRFKFFIFIIFEQCRKGWVHLAVKDIAFLTHHGPL